MPEPLHLLLADDDKDDRYFFDKALKALPIPARLTTVENGEKLMDYLSKNSEQLPDVLFLDLNMPRKNGVECLEEIVKDNKLKHLPVIIYSTSLHEDESELLYEKGAYYYIQKTELAELKKILQRVLELIIGRKFDRPLRANFILNNR